MEKVSPSTHPRLLKILEIECNYQRHKARLLKIETNKARTVKKDQIMDGVNNYRKSRFLSDMFRAKDNHQKLVKENSLLHDNLKKVYLRKSSTSSLSSFRKTESEKSLVLTKRNNMPTRERQRRISEENVRLRNKLLTTKSNLSKKRLMVDTRVNRTMEQERISLNAQKRR